MRSNHDELERLNPPQQGIPVDMLAPPAQQMGVLAPYDGPVDANPIIDSHTAHILGNMVGITIRQKVSWIEGLTQGICERRNRYTLHPGSGHEALTHPPFMSAMERSENCNRCCCAPYHSLFIEFKHTQDPLVAGPIGFTFEREGCCSKAVGCFNFMDCCLDSMRVHAGEISAGPNQAGKLSDYSKVIGGATQEKGCSLIPSLKIFDGPLSAHQSPSSMMHGPCIFGGCSEACCESEFRISRPSSEKMIGDVAVIRKLRPRNFGDFCAECCTDSDRYTIEFKDKSLTPQQKATLLGSMMLTDFMFFELDNGMVSCRDNKLVITFFLCYCSGCLCPCQLVLEGNNNH